MTLLIVVGIMLVVWVLLSCFVWWEREDWKGYGRLYKGEITTNFNAIPFARNSRRFISKKWKEVKPKSGIDKEIAEEEKEIAELERQKEKMGRLAELKRRKERLFSDVRGTESWGCKWCGSDDCLKPAYTVDGIAQYYCTSCHRWLNDGSSMV